MVRFTKVFSVKDQLCTEIKTTWVKGLNDDGTTGYILLTCITVSSKFNDVPFQNKI